MNTLLGFILSRGRGERPWEVMVSKGGLQKDDGGTFTEAEAGAIINDFLR